MVLTMVGTPHARVGFALVFDNRTLVWYTACILMEEVQVMCMTCERGASEFRDDLSRREYAISGMCQVCQDAVFGS